MWKLPPWPPAGDSWTEQTNGRGKVEVTLEIERSINKFPVLDNSSRNKRVSMFHGSQSILDKGIGGSGG